jgi:hypothetical protein
VASQQARTGAAGRTATVTLRRGRLRIVLVGFLVAMLGSFSLLFLALTTGFVSLDRNEPRVVIREFLQAVMIDHNAARAQTFMCDQYRAGDAIHQFKYSNYDDPGVVTTWGVTSLTESRDTAEATVTINFAVDRQNDFRYWRIELVRASDGWRVCSAHTDPSLAPK